MCKQSLRSNGSLVVMALCLSLMSTPVGAFAPQWRLDKDAPDGTDPVGGVVIWHVGNVSTSSMQAAVIASLCYSSYPVDILEDARSYIIPPNYSGATDMEKAGVARPAFWSVACEGAGGKLIWSTREDGGSGVGPVALGKSVGFMKPSTPDNYYTDVANTNCPGNGPFIGTHNYIRTLIIDGRSGRSVNATVWNCVNFTYDLARGIAATFDENTPYGTGVMRVPDISSSAIEPDKFASAYSENVSTSDLNLDGVKGDGLGTYTANNLTSVGLAQLIFNTPVNLLMYQDLQRAQFPSGHPLFTDCHPNGANYNLNVPIVGTSALSSVIPPPGIPPVLITTFNIMGNTEKCMPSLTANEIRSIFGTGGAIRSATDFQAELGTGVFTELSATRVYDAADTAATDNTIQICRRSEGSGTQAQFNAMLLGYPCDPNTADGSTDTLRPEGEGPLTPFVTENESSGDLEKCLNDYNNGTNTTNKNTLLRKRWAIGIQSLDKNAPTAGTLAAAGVYADQYRFIKIDGFAPTLVNAHAGDYFNVARQWLQYRPVGALQVTVNAFSALVGPPFNSGINPLYAPSQLPALNKTHAFGISGWLATPSTRSVPESLLPDSKLNFSRPVAWFHRVTFGSSKPNTCALPSAFKKTTLTPTVFGNPDLLTATAITVGPQNCSNNGGAPLLLGADQNCYTGILGKP